MFDWSETADHYVSSRFWIYWIVTIPLTVSVVAIWLLSTSEQIKHKIPIRTIKKPQFDAEEG